MKTKNTIFFITFILLLGLSDAHAAGTAANTTVSNTASVAFTVGGISQPTVTSPPATFVVDRKIIFTVTTLDTNYVQVGPAATSSQVLKFQVTNSSNDVMDFNLAYAQDIGSGDPFGGTDNFDTTNVKIFKDSNGNGIFDSASDTQITFLDEVPADGTVTVFVVSNMPTPLPANSSISSGTLTATAHLAGLSGTLGVVHTQTSGADTPAVDTVFADVAGDTDIARDGKHSDDSAYKVFIPALVATKIVTLISDPISGTTDPKAIPGAVVEYCIQIKNEGNAVADNVTMTDTIPTGSTFVSASIVAGGSVSGAVCNTATGTAEDDDTTGTDDDLSTGPTGNISGSVVTTKVSSLAAGATTTSRFRVTINP